MSQELMIHLRDASAFTLGVLLCMWIYFVVVTIVVGFGTGDAGFHRRRDEVAAMLLITLGLPFFAIYLAIMLPRY